MNDPAHARRRASRDSVRHRPWLAELATAAPAGPGAGGGESAAARRHLDACHACRREAEQLALVSFAVNRAWRSVRQAEPPVDAWPRLRARVLRRSERVGWAASSVVGLAIATGLAIALFVPIGIGDRRPVVLGEAGYAPAPLAAPRTAEDSADQRWLVRQANDRAQIAAGSLPAQPIVPLRRAQSRSAEEPRPDRYAAGPGQPSRPAMVAL